MTEAMAVKLSEPDILAEGHIGSADGQGVLREARVPSRN
jgi:hypothetical protein